MSALRKAPLIGRRALVAVTGFVLIAGLVIVFSGALTRSTDLEGRVEQAQAEVDARRLELAAGEAEQAFFETDEFVRWQARVHGFGEKAQGERLFALPDDAPPPAPLTPIGPRTADQPLAPIDAWMELLFGA